MTKLKFKRKFLLLLFLLCAIVTEVGARKIYFYDAAGWNDVYIHAWGNGDTYPDPKMTKVPNTDHWMECTIDDKYTYLAFVHYVDGQNKGSIENLAIPTTANAYYVANPDGSGSNWARQIIGDGGTADDWTVPGALRAWEFSSTGYNLRYTIPGNYEVNFNMYCSVASPQYSGRGVTFEYTNTGWRDYSDSGDNNITVKSHPQGGKRTFVCNPTRNRCNVEYEVVHQGTRKVYYYNTNGWSNVYIWTWPNNQMYTMSKVAGTDWWYECNISDNHEGLNFQDYDQEITNKTGNTGHHLTSDLVIANKDKIYYIDDYSNGSTAQFSGGKWVWENPYKTIGDHTGWAIGNEVEMSFASTGYKFNQVISGESTVNFKFVNSSGSWIGDGTTHYETSGGVSLDNCSEGGGSIKIIGDCYNRTIVVNPWDETYWVEFYSGNDITGNIPECPDPNFKNNEIGFGAEDVVSYFSEYYGNFTDTKTWTEGGWAEIKQFSQDISNNYVLFNKVKIGGVADNWKTSVPDYLYDRAYVDIYPAKDMYLRIYPDHNEGDKVNKDQAQIVKVEAGKWNSVEIDLTKFTNLVHNKINILSIQTVTKNGDQAQGTFAVDNAFFWRSGYATHTPGTVDTDPKGLNWNTSDGATDFVKRVYYSWIDNSDDNNTVYVRNANEAHDGNVNKSTDTKRGIDAGYYVIQLGHKIEVSDVELIWGNGFPKRYDVYLTDEWPIKNNQLDPSVVTDSKKLYGRTDFTINYSPYYDIESNMSGKSGRFVVVQMHERGNTFFSYALKEVHVGSRENYGGATGLGLDDIRIKNGEANAVNVKPYYINQRGANVGNAASGVTITAKKNGVECPEFVTVTPKSDGTFTIYATAPGDYTLEMAEGGKTGTAYLYVTQSWTTELDEARDPKKNYKYSVITGNQEVKIAVSHIEESNEYTLRQHETDWTSYYEPSSYTEQMLKDGNEQKDDNLSRWCSGGSFTGPKWPNNNSEHGPEWALIDLGKNYNLTDFEIIWEEAYAKNYAVYGFKNLTEISDKLSDVTDVTTLNFSKSYLLNESDKRTAIKNYTDDASNSHRLFFGQNVTPTDVFPMNDIESSIEKEVRYILVKMTEKGTNFGYSIWEFYAGGIPVDELNAMNRLEAVAPDMTIIVNYSGVQSVTAKGEMNGTPVEKVNFEPVEFTVFKEDGVTEVTGKLKFDPRGDGTYLVTGLEVGNYKVKMKGDNKNPSDNFIYGWFNVEVIATKRPMKKDVAKSDDKKLVFDNGYYVEQVLKDEADKKYTIIDMTNVDFTNRYLESQVVEHDGEPTEDDIRDGKIVSKANYATANLSQVTLPAPYTVTEAGGAAKMNPNAVYFTYEPLIKGENVAKQKAGDIWRIKTLRIWDGWDFNPSFDGVGMTVEKYLRFYTHIEPKQYSFIVFPFNVHRSELNAKGVSLFRPVRYDENENTMEIEEVTNDNDGGSAWVGQPYLIYTESDAYKGPSYALTIVGDGSLNLSTAPCTIGNISFTGTYVSTKAPKSNGNETYFWYNTPKNQFSTVTTDDVTIPPFFAYMKVINNTSSAKPANGMRFVLRNDDIVTVVTEVETTNSVQGIYTIGGVKVTDDINELNRLPKGMYIVNGKKIVK